MTKKRKLKASQKKTSQGGALSTNQSQSQENTYVDKVLTCLQNGLCVSHGLAPRNGAPFKEDFKLL